jgi:hypothetical protein
MTGIRLTTLLAVTASVLALAACGGADGVASPGEGGFTGGGGGGGTGGGGGGGGGTGPAADCPSGFSNVGTIVAAVGGELRVCQLPAQILGNLVVPLRAGTIYSISGRVDVGQDRGGNAASPIAGAQQGILTIDPGVRIYGSAGLDYIVVNRGSQIFAQGTSTQPIVFTSKQSIEGATGVDSIGQWGGIVLLGRANISNCPGGTAYGSANCEAQVEGTNALYGGNANADNTGVMRYVRVQHSGFQILPNNELNGITLAGVGSGTTFEYVQVHNSSDDGFEWFGGKVNARYLVATGNDDDSFDTDQGFDGSIQYGIVVQRANGGDKMIEASMASLATGNPRSRPQFSNITFVGRGVNDALVFNTGTDVNMYNSVVRNTGADCLDMDNLPATTGTFRSVFFACTNPFDADADDESAIFTNASNVPTGTSTLTGTFINGANETAVAVTSPTGLSSHFVLPTYIGGVRDAADTWWSGWTCGLAAGSTC